MDNVPKEAQQEKKAEFLTLCSSLLAQKAIAPVALIRWHHRLYTLLCDLLPSFESLAYEEQRLLDRYRAATAHFLSHHPDSPLPYLENNDFLLQGATNPFISEWIPYDSRILQGFGLDPSSYSHARLLKNDGNDLLYAFTFHYLISQKEANRLSQTEQVFAGGAATSSTIGLLAWLNLIQEIKECSKQEAEKILTQKLNQAAYSLPCSAYLRQCINSYIDNNNYSNSPAAILFSPLNFLHANDLCLAFNFPCLSLEEGLTTPHWIGAASSEKKPPLRALFLNRQGKLFLLGR